MPTLRAKPSEVLQNQAGTTSCAFVVVGTQGIEDVNPFYHKQFDDLSQAPEWMTKAVEFGLSCFDDIHESLSDPEINDDSQ